MEKFTAKTLYKCQANHGESILWDETRGVVMWMDCFGKKMYEYDPASEKCTEIPLEFNPMAILPNEDGNFLGVGEDCVYQLDSDKKIVKELIKIIHPKATDRFNDCEIGPDGKLYLGSMGQEGEPDEGKLYRLDFDFTTEVVLDKVAISNGIIWIPEKDLAYYTDSVKGEIYSFTFKDGKFSDKKTIFARSEYFTDGNCLDAEGFIWQACWGEGKVIRINPENGEIVAEVIVDGANQTSACSMAGKDYSKLVITTSRLDMDEEALAKYSASGDVFIADVGVKGTGSFTGKYKF